MPKSLRSSSIACVLATLLFAPAARGEAIHLAGGAEPAVLSGLGEIAGLTAVAIRFDGAAAVLAVKPAAATTGTLRVYSAGAAGFVSVPLAGEVRDLLYSTDGAVVYGIVHRSAKRSAGESYLIRLDQGAKKVRRVLRLPSTANALDYSPARGALLVACRNEIRTFSLPELRSGPLYYLTGPNLSVAALASSDLVLVGREHELVLMHLGDPPGRPDMPVRERLPLETPAVDLATVADGSRAVARLADGRILDVRFGPLRASGAGSAAAVTSLSKGRSPNPIPLAPLPSAKPAPDAVPAAQESPARPVEARPTEPTPAPATPQPTRPAPAPAVNEPPPEPPVTQPVPPAPIPTVAAPTETAPPATPSTRPVTVDSTPGMFGAIGGPAAALVEWVVLRGPNNLLREARRVRPTPDGRWNAERLAPGRYRVQLDGGGERVLASDPAFAAVTVPERGVVEAPAFLVIGSH